MIYYPVTLAVEVGTLTSRSHGKEKEYNMVTFMEVLKAIGSVAIQQGRSQQLQNEFRNRCLNLWMVIAYDLVMTAGRLPCDQKRVRKGTRYPAKLGALLFTEFSKEWGEMGLMTQVGRLPLETPLGLRAEREYLNFRQWFVPPDVQLPIG